MCGGPVGHRRSAAGRVQRIRGRRSRWRSKGIYDAVGLCIALFSQLAFAHTAVDVAEALIVLMSLQVALYGMLGLSIVVIIMLVARTFRKKTACGVTLGFWILIVLLGLPGISAFVSGDMRVTGGGVVGIATIMAVVSTFCLVAPAVQYLVLNRKSHSAGTSA